MLGYPIFGRELRVVQESLREIEPQKSFEDKHFKCQDSLDQTMESLNNFCATLPKEHTERMDSVWLFDNQNNFSHVQNKYFDGLQDL